MCQARVTRLSCVKTIVCQAAVRQCLTVWCLTAAVFAGSGNQPAAPAGGSPCRQCPGIQKQIWLYSCAWSFKSIYSVRLRVYICVCKIVYECKGAWMQRCVNGRAPNVEFRNCITYTRMGFQRCSLTMSAKTNSMLDCICSMLDCMCCRCWIVSVASLDLSRSLLSRSLTFLVLHASCGMPSVSFLKVSTERNGWGGHRQMIPLDVLAVNVLCPLHHPLHPRM